MEKEEKPKRERVSITFQVSPELKERVIAALGEPIGSLDNFVKLLECYEQQLQKAIDEPIKSSNENSSEMEQYEEACQRLNEILKCKTRDIVDTVICNVDYIANLENTLKENVAIADMRENILELEDTSKFEKYLLSKVADKAGCTIKEMLVNRFFMVYQESPGDYRIPRLKKDFIKRAKETFNR